MPLSARYTNISSRKYAAPSKTNDALRAFLLRATALDRSTYTRAILSQLPILSNMQADPDKFVDYYASESLSSATLDRFSGIKRAIENAAKVFNLPAGKWQVADIGCGAGTQCAIWARDGHHVHGIDINSKLVELGRERAAAEKLNIEFHVGSATELPWSSSSMDICLCPELLEHVVDWESVLSEAVRIIRPGGVLFLSTSSRLCPVQQEFDLPLYSWYPTRLKRYYERLSTTTRPELANHAKYPAVNWFTYYELRDRLKQYGFRCLDRFDVAATVDRGFARNALLRLITSNGAARFLGQVATPGTIVFACKTHD